jgi:ribosome-associated toxin RatA of RatAB toxin-antitoxin module
MAGRRLLGFGLAALVALGSAVAASAAAAPAVAASTAAWPLTPAQRAAVERGDIVVVAERRAARSDQPVAATLAALKVAATPDAVFDVLTDCAAAPAWMPHLVECRILEADAAGTSELIAHRVHYGWFAPRIDYVFRVQLRDRRRITFENVSGDLAQNDGVWALEAAADGTSTIVTYTVSTRPKFYVPQWLYRRAVRAELPGMLRALRQRAESAPPDTRRPAGA